MGAKQRAQNRSKKPAKGSMKGSPMSQKHLNQSIEMPSLSPQVRGKALQNWQNFANGKSHNFTMSEEARNTERHVFGWGNTRLRDQKVTFVSAGTLHRDEMQPSSEEDDKETLETNSAIRNEELDTMEKNVSNQSSVEEYKAPLGQVSEAEVRSEESILEGQASPIRITVTDAQPTSKHSDDSSDSEEEIVFAGRQNSAQPSRRPTPVPETSSSLPIRSSSTKRAAQPIPVRAKSPTPPIDYLPTVPAAANVPRRDSPDLHNNLHKLRGYNDEEAIMQDYIDNMVLDDSDDPVESSKPSRRNEHFRFHNSAGEEHVKVQTLSYSRNKIHDSELDQAIDWDSDDLADFDDLSTTDEEIEEVSQVIRNRTRVNGLQYLVVATGKGASDAKWILHKKLVSESAVKEIKMYEEIREFHVEQYEDDDDEDDEESSSGEEDEEALQDLIDNIDSEDDENERIFKHTSRMTDEQIARALAKQEELGMDADEILLFNGDVGDIDQPDMDDAPGLGDDFTPFTTRNLRRKQKKKQRDSFPSAEAFADALDQDPYGAFDIMDFDRPSLKPKKKGRKSDYPFDLEGLEDEDLRSQLVNTWTKDREKKAARKREKEEARLQASLDVSDGSDPTVIKFRIRQFLVQDTTTLELSPMEPAVRAAVHRLAKALKLNSRSVGKEGVGVGRYPVLTKTVRTPSYSIENIWEIDNLLSTRKFFPKNLYKSQKLPRGSGAVKHRGGGGGVASGATYRDGDEVAASAPEIGADNRGRAMLEKMGWTTGMAIGAIGNKGSLDPIRHIVKTTKAGLG